MACSQLVASVPRSRERRAVRDYKVEEGRFDDARLVEGARDFSDDEDKFVLELLRGITGCQTTSNTVRLLVICLFLALDSVQALVIKAVKKALRSSCGEIGANGSSSWSMNRANESAESEALLAMQWS